MTKTSHAARAALLLSLLMGSAIADTISIVVPFGPGGTSDLVARMLADDLSKLTGQTVIVENKPGAQGMIGAQSVARSAPDGRHAILMSNSLSSIEFLLRSDVQLDALRDFTPTCVIARFPSAFFVRSSLPYKTFKEFVEAARKAPGKFTFAYASAVMRLNAEMLAKREGIELTGIPNKSLGEALTDVIGDRVDITINDVNSAMPFVKSNKLRPLMLTTSKRFVLWPDIPSAAEAGLNSVDVYSSISVFLPKGVTERVRTDFTDALEETLQKPEMRKQLAGFGYETLALCGAAANDYLGKDVAQWRESLAK